MWTFKKERHIAVTLCKKHRAYKCFRESIAYLQLVLHEDEIKNSKFRTIEDWIHFREEMSEEDLTWFEQQAYEFAGRLLVPKEHLVTALEAQRKKIETYKNLVSNDNDERLIDAISKVICDKFRVSSNVIYKRIRSEKVWDEMKF